MKKFIFNSMLLGGLVMTSCSDNVLEKPVTEEAAQSFAELFGKIDPKQDWSLAERKSVTVEVGTSSTVYIYAKNEIAYTLVGQYENVSGTRELKFDAPELTTDFLVSVNGEAKKVANGEKVSFGAKSRGAFISGFNRGVFKKHTDITTFSLTDGNSVADFINVMEESDPTNATMEGVHYNFFAVSEGDSEEIANIQGAALPAVYPLYWNSGMDHELGIYIRTVNEEDGSVLKPSDAEHYPIWRSEEYVNASADPKEIEWTVEDKVSDEWDFYVERKPIKDYWGNYSTDNFTQNAKWRGGGNSNGYYIEQGKLAAIHTRGFNINLPKGTTYGFYLKVWHHWNGERYSDDKEVRIWYTDASLNTDEDTHAAYFESGNMQNNYKYLCFEDFDSKETIDYTVTSDRDFNDLVFVFDPAPIIVTNVSRPWVLALEDLGTTDDYDFNDAVIGIEHIAGQTTARVTPLAVGATLPIYLKYNGSQVGEELHSYWNAERTDGKFPMINTSGAYKEATVKFQDITVDKNFSLLEFTENQTGGLSFQVGDSDKETVNATPPHKGIAPQVICVPWNWSWPRERTRIDKAYTGFTNWVGQAEEDKKNGAIWGNNYLGNTGNWISTNEDKELVIISPWKPEIDE